MPRMLLPITAMLAACTPSPQKAAMPSPNPTSATTVPISSKPTHGSEQAAAGPLSDSPAEAEGRRILSTAFVRVGPDGYLTVELRNGRVVALRGVAMGPKDYCGVLVVGDPARTKYCGGYADVAAARPGGAPALDQPDVAASNAAERK